MTTDTRPKIRCAEGVIDGRTRTQIENVDRRPQLANLG